tara:strand:+ start:1585 stop:1821 length:237 start_codon:yes stop_codon:yes gene_type:complete
MLILLLTACASVAVADQPEYEYGDWEELAGRIQDLNENGELIDVEPIITPPEVAVEPDSPPQEETPEEAPEEEPEVED